MTEPVGLARGLTNYGDRDFSLYLRRSFARSMGYSSRCWRARSSASPTPHSGFNNCHRHFPELLEAVKRGVAGGGRAAARVPDHLARRGLPRPTSLKFRNLMAMDTEEMIRAQPMDAVVLMGGCDKTVPAQLMGAASAGNARHPADRRPDDDRALSRRAGRRLHRLPPVLGASTAPARSTPSEIDEVEGRLATTAGTCAVMGTASHHGLASPRRSA